MRKKVIFVGGTSYSGSTFLDMILANDPNGFSCGEIRPLFYPYRKHHYNPRCGCGETDCHIWEQILKNGVTNIYNTIFDLFPNINFIIDSSKDPFWINQHARSLNSSAISVKHILIWKTPYDFACSYKKRGKKNWLKDWVSYHRKYFSIIDEFFPLKYSDFVNDVRILENVCEYLQIPYFSNKHKYWDKKHHTLFGNNSAKIHLYKKNNSNYLNIAEKLPKEYNLPFQSRLNIDHQNIFYQRFEDQDLKNEVNYLSQGNKYLDLIMKTLLNNNKLKNISHQNISFNYSKVNLYLKFIKYRIKNSNLLSTLRSMNI